ncbi:MAG TPA: H4MPT-linked C1 transfer pathway protein, partial [Methylocella sp.]|nr:H4MPT-linked C1 transfer pathway protein [Methylocella sp.]
FAEAQLREIMDAAALVLSRGVLPDEAPIAGAGAGRGIIEELARRMNRPYAAFGHFIKALPEAGGKACDCAAASAVALLASAHPLSA